MPIKVIFAIGLLLVLTSCNQPYINFTVEAPKIANGTFFVYDDNGNVVYGANFKNGRLLFNHKYLKQPGYYTFKVAETGKWPDRGESEIYLEPGDYHIKMNGQKYPLIITASTIQNDLTMYHRLVDSMKLARGKSLGHYSKRYDHSENLAPAAANALADMVNQKRTEFNNADRDALSELVKHNPKSVAAAHIMTELDYEHDPEGFYTVFKRLSSEARNTDDGKDMGERLPALMALLPGHLAPMIAGTTPDGKSFNTSGLNKKIYLLEFWKAGSTMTRVNHTDDKISIMMSQIQDQKDFGMIGVSLDHKREWWLAAVKDDQLTWPQYADMKGNDSDNLTNWQITTLPAYFLLDSKWHIIESDVDMPRDISGKINMPQLPGLINSYLANH